MAGHNKNISVGPKYKQALKRKRDKRNRMKKNKKYKMRVKKRQNKQHNIKSDI